MALPVFVGVVPLTKVTSFVLTEGYKVVPIAGAQSSFAQLTTPTTKTIDIEALLVDGERSLRPLLEALALTNRFLAAATSPLTALAGIPVVARLGVHLDMQITNMVFTQDNQLRDTFKLKLQLQHVPRSPEVGAFGAGADLALGAAGGFI